MRLHPGPWVSAVLAASALIPLGLATSLQGSPAGPPADRTDHTEEELVAPGVTHRSCRFTRHGSPFSVHVLEVDPNVPAVNVLPVRALDRAIGKETVSSMAKRFGAVAAVNAGYFEVSGNHAGASDGVYLLHGRVLTGGSNRSALVMCQEKRFREQAEIDVVDFRGVAKAPGGSTYPINGMNRSRRPGELLVYTPDLGPTTKTSTAGVEVPLDPSGRVLSVKKGSGNSPIPIGGSVLSATGDGALWLEKHARAGARIRVETRLERRTPSARGCRPDSIVGAGPRLVEGGKAKVTEERFAHAPQRHPRTAFAITRRGTFLFYTVDGRQPASAGMTLQELASELIALGALEAINLDGGGSTTMVVNGTVRNSPSDRRERAVSDGVLVFSIANVAALGSMVDRLSDGQIQTELAAKLREALGRSGSSKKKLDAVRKAVRQAGPGQITPAAARVIEEAAASLSGAG